VSFPFRDFGQVAHGGDLPERADIVIVGGGVIGVSAALYAVRAGLSVLLLEKGRVAAEQSSRNWGWIRVQGRDMAEIPIAQEAQGLWQSLDRECRGRLGVETVGVSYLARSEGDLEGFEGWLAEAKAHGVSSRMRDARGVVQDLGCPRAPWLGALHTPTDMKGEPWVAVPELARLAASEGAMIRERIAVRGLDMQAGRVAGVVTEAGHVACDAVILAGGAWSSLFLKRHGVDIPQLSVRSTALATEPVKQVVSGAGVDDRLAFRPRADGGYTLAPSAFSELYTGRDALRHLKVYVKLALQGDFDTHLKGLQPPYWPDSFLTARRWTDDEITPFERLRILDPGPNRARAEDVVRLFQEIWPELGPVSIKAMWGGMIDVMPDVVPVVDQVGALPGLTVATGMCGHGFGIGPAFGRIAVALARGDAVEHDLSRFRIGRFADGSRLVPGPNL
jgi:glycine/D-amino acid oxidase-like deaminating enzyme